VTSGSALGLLVGAALTGWWASRLSKVASFQSAYRAWAARVGGRVCTHGQASAWLDRYWAGEFMADLAVSGFGARITLEVQGHPVLCVVDPIQWDAQHSATVQLYVATEWTSQLPPKLNGYGSEQLRALGFIPNENEGGVLVRGGSDAIQRFRQPGQIATLSELVTSAIRLVESHEAARR